MTSSLGMAMVILFCVYPMDVQTNCLAFINQCFYHRLFAFIAEWEEFEMLYKNKL